MPSPDEYSVGWICAIAAEYVAAQAFLDETHETSEVSPNDNNNYALGKIGKHNVVIAVLPDGEYGTSSAAVVARDMLQSFRNIKIGLLVGVGGGAPSSKHDIRLGDIVVSTPRDGKSGVFQYDFGKTIQEKNFQPTGFLAPPPPVLRTAVNGLKAYYELNGHQIEAAICSVLEKRVRLRKNYKRPDPSNDRLYQSEITHPENNAVSCITVCGNDASKLIQRRERSEDEDIPVIHYGLIASANQLMKDALVRDRLAADKDILCFEMEAAGLMNHFPCLVIRGICDYSDSHKNKEWQGYAAMAAAAYAKELLYQIAPNKIEAEKRIEETLSSILDTVSVTGEKVETIRSKLDKREDLEILEWLTPINYGPQQSDFINRRHPGTGQWLLDSEEFQTWLKTGGQTLFCLGIPGAGKSIFASIVVDHLCGRFNDPTVGVAYLYFNYQRQDEQKVETLFPCLLKQLAQKWTSFQGRPDCINVLYNAHKHKGTRPLFEEIAKAVHSMASLYSRVFIIIDALDEFKASERTEFLTRLFELQVQRRANILMTSRFISGLQEKFSDNIHTTLEVRASSEDVRRYLESHMNRLQPVEDSPLLQEEVKTRIIQLTDGMFLLAQLHLESLVGKTTKKAIRKALNELPTGDAAYDIAYENAMERIKGQLKDHEELAMQVLSWIICAKRPLEIIELQHALAVEIGERELDQDNIPELEVMISVCAGLVTVDNDRRIIRLVHYTTLEYFVRSQKRWFPHANVHVTEACIAYLSFRTFNCVSRISEPEYEELLEENPFYDYAAFHWGDHARAAPAEKIQGPVLGFLKSPSKVSSSGRVVMEKFWYIGKRDVPIELTALHLTAFFGLKDAAEVLIQHADDPDFKDVGGRTPLSWAATCGNGELAKVLLKSPKVNPNSRDAKGRTPLSYAAERGHTSVVEAFIDIPNLNPNIEEYAQRAGHKYVMIGGRTPLSWAAANGHSGIVKLLLTLKVIDSDHPDLLGRTPLSFAARNGHEAIVNLLLARKEVNPNSTDRLPRHGSIVPDSTGLNTHAYGRTPLSWAAGNGHEEVVKLMLSTDRVHKNTVDSYRQSPLLWAAAYGHVAVVKLLLGERVDIDRGWIKPRLSPDFYWGWVKSPLFQVALTGDEAVACLLLKAGANVERKDEDGQTPLFFAAMAGHEAVARLLLEYGSNVELKDKYGQTPLFFAARAGHKAVVRLLLEHRANVKSEEKHS